MNEPCPNYNNFAKKCDTNETTISVPFYICWEIKTVKKDSFAINYSEYQERKRKVWERDKSITLSHRSISLMKVLYGSEGRGI